ncbi:MAG: ATP synthase F1 subunit delta [Saprospiraceae bacterium]
MSAIRIASRYAKSLLDLAKEQNIMDDVVSDIEGFAKIVKNRDFYLLVKSPIVNTDKKVSIFKEFFEGKVNKLTMAWFNIILRKKREVFLPEIATEFISQYRALKGISTVKLTTATAISDTALEKIKAKLLNSDITAQSIEIETTIDESLIGGFVIEIGDKLIDASVAHKLNKLSKELTNKEYAKAF